MTLDVLLEQASTQDLYLNNLFEIEPNRWWCEFRQTEHTPYGTKSARGSTPQAAMQAALAAHLQPFPEAPQALDEYQDFSDILQLL